MAKPVYIFDNVLASATDSIPHLKGRAHMVHELISACGLLPLLDVRESKPGTTDDILTFHSNSYVEFLTGSNNLENVDEGDEIRDLDADSGEEEFGLGYDCPTFPKMMEFGRVVVGGTLSAVDAIINGSKIAINWTGGWHHAQRNEASGFCYVNDIVIGIQRLMKHFKKVLYIDLDSHHGDGVENAFSYTNKVLTLSIHHYEVGYFPGTGLTQDIGFGRGKYHAVNVPLKSGAVDADFVSVFEKAFACVRDNFCPDVIVAQCGTDCLAGDPLGNFNLTEQSLVHCVKQIMSINLPVVFLGGGGYSLSNAAKTWTALTFTILGRDTPIDIPEHDFFLHYGPDFSFHVPSGLRRNENTVEYLSTVLNDIQDNLKKIPRTASVFPLPPSDAYHPRPHTEPFRSMFS